MLDWLWVPLHPRRRGAPLELGDVGGVGERVADAQQGLDVDAVVDRAFGDGHGSLLFERGFSQPNCGRPAIIACLAAASLYAPGAPAPRRCHGLPRPTGALRRRGRPAGSGDPGDARGRRGGLRAPGPRGAGPLPVGRGLSVGASGALRATRGGGGSRRRAGWRAFPRGREGTSMRRVMALAAAGALIGLGAGLAAPAMGATTEPALLHRAAGREGQQERLHHRREGAPEGQEGRHRPAGLHVPRHKADCKITVKLTGRGQIKLTATFTENSDHGPLTIVGGTGEFAGASGDGNYRNVARTRPASSCT